MLESEYYKFKLNNRLQKSSSRKNELALKHNERRENWIKNIVNTSTFKEQYMNGSVVNLHPSEVKYRV